MAGKFNFFTNKKLGTTFNTTVSDGAWAKREKPSELIADLVETTKVLEDDNYTKFDKIYTDDAADISDWDARYYLVFSGDSQAAVVEGQDAVLKLADTAYEESKPFKSIRLVTF